MAILATPSAERYSYLDHAASSPIRESVFESMVAASALFANPSGSHRLAREARARLEGAREAVASAFGFEPSEVIFTSGGTEADNLAIYGTTSAISSGLRRIVVSSIEHKAVLAPASALAKESGVVVDLLGATRTGVIDLNHLEDLLGDDVALVSVMAANNETGTIQPLDEVARLVRSRSPRARIHTDAVQAAAYLDPGAIAPHVDLVSISAHKLGGPKGAGALMVRKGTPIYAMVRGGGQEFDLRAGTNDVVGAVGLAAALEAAQFHRIEEIKRLESLALRLFEGACAIPGVQRTVTEAPTLPSHCHLLVEGVTREELLVLLDRKGVCASGGSSCASGALEPSHVLEAMGVEERLARGALRLSMGHTTRDGDVDRLLDVLPRAIEALR